MNKKYIHDVCSCGCSNLIIPLGINIDQLVLRCVVKPNQQYIRATIKTEEKTMHGWEVLITDNAKLSGSEPASDRL